MQPVLSALEKFWLGLRSGQRLTSGQYLASGLILLSLILFLRLISLSFSPLLDTTETRYAGIAQMMVLLNDWITPRLPQGLEPFLAKPPLSFWLTAVSFKAFGCSEFSARLPNFLEAILIIPFVYRLGTQWFSRRIGLLGVLVLWSSIFFFIQAGTVNLDMLVCLHLTASMWAFWEIQSAIRHKKRWQRFGLEIFLGVVTGLGLLNKGPFTLVLSLGSLAAYALLARDIRILFKPNWLIIMGLALGIAFPWYWAVQASNPDFFDYFFVQEHFLRYLKSDYGDRYGSAHHQPYGMSWLFLVGAFMPWSPVLLSPIAAKLTGWKNKKSLKLSPEILFLLAWIGFTPLFFTFARSILMNYILASLPPLSILVASQLDKVFESQPDENDAIHFFKIPSILRLVAVLSLLIAGVLFAFSGASPYQLSPVVLIISSITIMLVSFLVGSLASQRGPRALIRLLLLVVLSMPLTLVAWYGPIANSIEDRKSMKQVVKRLAAYDPGLSKVFFYKEAPPGSWHFYIQSPLLNDPSGGGLSQPYPKIVSNMAMQQLPPQAILLVREDLLDEFRLSSPELFIRKPLLIEDKYSAYQNL